VNAVLGQVLLSCWILTDNDTKVRPLNLSQKTIPSGPPLQHAATITPDPQCIHKPASA